MARKTGPAAANKVKKNFSILFNYGIRKGLGITFNPARLADKWKENPDGFHTWTDQEIAQYQAYHATGTKPRLALELFLWTGAARQDAARMGWQNLKGDRLDYARGKTGIFASLPVHPDLARELAHVPRDQMLFLTHGAKARPYKPETLGNWFKDQCVAAGLHHCTAHGLRKSLGTLMANEGRSPDQIRAVLAHKTNKEGSTYTDKADRARLANDMSGLTRAEHEQKLSNFPARLDKKEVN